MHYTIYKITNEINNKIYIGKHQTYDLNDKYMGSGKSLNRAIKKHGIENFSKEILFIFDNEEDMNRKEAELVTDEFCLREDVYNICPGGKGGWGYINENKLNLYGNNGKTPNVKQNFLKGKETQNFLKANDPEWKKRLSNNISKSLIGRKPTFLGKKHSELSKQKMKITRKDKQLGEKNSQFGTCWVTNGNKPIKIKKEQLKEYISNGYVQGRKTNI